MNSPCGVSVLRVGLSTNSTAADALRLELLDEGEQVPGRPHQPLRGLHPHDVAFADVGNHLGQLHTQLDAQHSAACSDMSRLERLSFIHGHGRADFDRGIARLSGLRRLETCRNPSGC